MREYSENLISALKSVSNTNKDLLRVQDPDQLNARYKNLKKTMDGLEKKFGYKRNPEEPKEDEMDLIKLAKESYGITLSLEFHKARKQNQNRKKKVLPKTLNFDPNKTEEKFIPTNAFKKIRQTTDAKLPAGYKPPKRHKLTEVEVDSDEEKTAKMKQTISHRASLAKFMRDNDIENAPETIKTHKIRKLDDSRNT